MPLNSETYASRGPKRELPTLMQRSTNSQEKQGRIRTVDQADANGKASKGVDETKSSRRQRGHEASVPSTKVIPNDHQDLTNHTLTGSKYPKFQFSKSNSIQPSQNQNFRPAFDDTQSLILDDTSIFDGPISEYSSIQHTEQIPNHIQVQHDREPNVVMSENMWQEINEERLQQSNDPLRNHVLKYEQMEQANIIEPINDGSYDGIEDWENSPSRVQLTEGYDFPAQHQNNNMTDAPGSIPVQSHEYTTNRFKIHQQPKPAVPEPQSIQLPINTKYSSKVSSYQELSSDEEPLPPQQKIAKRTFDQLDYDFDTLKNMSIAELDKVPFSVDPQLNNPPPTVDTYGNPITLSQKLTSLSKMQPEEQRTTFQSLTEYENEQAATWFLQQLSSEMKKLMATRLERRKIALKYEMEIKQRQKLVEIKADELDEDLKGLKRGGNQLIEGRKAPAVSVSTPKR